MTKVIIKIDDVKYYECQNCGVYVKDKFEGKIKKKKYCIPCLSLGVARLEIKNVVNGRK